MNSKNLVLIASFPDSVLSFRGDLISDFQNLGYEVHVIGPKTSTQKEREFSSRCIIYHSVSLQRNGTNPIKDIKFLFDLVKVIYSVKPSIVLSYTIKPVIYGTLASKFCGVKKTFSLITGLGYGFTENSGRSRSHLRKLLRNLYRFSLKYNEVIFFQNTDDKELFEKLNIMDSSQKSVVVNGSGVNIQHFEKQPLPNSINFLLIARLLGDKGVREYVEAARLLKNEYPSSICRLAGWIDSNPDAIKQSELDGWIKEGTIEYIGKLHDVRGAIKQCSVYVLPSYREGTPRSVLEAMSMGRPIITTDAPGCKETVVDGLNGYLVPVQDSHMLYSSMKRMINNEGLVESMGRKSREIAVEKYDVKKVNKQIISNMGIDYETSI